MHNVADAYGRTATFMPKPLYGDNGSGHARAHVDLERRQEHLRVSGYAGLSDTAPVLHRRYHRYRGALNGFTNPSTNLQAFGPQVEAPVSPAYSARNRSASIRIPYVGSPKAPPYRRRFPDPSANPYLAFAALLMAGLDGIQNKIHPGDAAWDKNLYDLPPEEAKDIPQVRGAQQAPKSWTKAVRSDQGRRVLRDDFIDAFIELKSEEEIKVRTLRAPAGIRAVLQLLI